MDTTKALPAFSLGLPPGIEALVKRAVGLANVEAAYVQARAQTPPANGPGAFCERLLQVLQVGYHWDQGAAATLAQVAGPVVVACNHPMGGLEALVLLALLGQTRPEARLMVNAAVDLVPELRPALLGVHIMARDASATRHARNLAPLRACVRQLRAGGTLALFPAGEVATMASLRAREVVEAPWHAHLGSLIALGRATTVPVWIDGGNSALFHYLGAALPSLRLPLLVRELTRRPPRIRVHIGQPIEFAGFETGATPAQITAVVRRACLLAAVRS